MKKRFTGLLFFLLGCWFVLWLNQPDSEKPLESRWQKIKHSGEPVSAWSGPWACVYDEARGLLWEVKTDSETIHDGYWSYSWFNGEVGEKNLGDCYFEKDRCDTLDLITRTNQERLCGVSGWRLPTAAELASIVDQDVRPGDPKVAKAYFPQIKRGDYWTADYARPLQGTFRYLKEGAVAINFIEGKRYVLPYRNAAFVMLVSDQYLPQESN